MSYDVNFLHKTGKNPLLMTVVHCASFQTVLPLTWVILKLPNDDSMNRNPLRNKLRTIFLALAKMSIPTSLWSRPTIKFT